MTQFEEFGVADTFQLGADVVIPAGTIIAIKKLGREQGVDGPWVMRVDILRPGDEKPRHALPENLEAALMASRSRKP